MKTIILDLNKTPYENGKISGEYFKERVAESEIKQYLKNAEKQHLKEKSLEILNNLKESYPIYYEEIRGKADGLGIELNDYFSIMCPELYNFGFEHCTTIVCKKGNGNYLLSHNEDDFYINGNFCLAKVKIDEKNWFYTNDMFNMPFGNGFSWNSYGIVKTINYTHEENFNIEYLPRYFAQRHIAEARSIDDLIQRCQQMNTASGFHVSAIDLNTNKAVSIEVYNDTIDVEVIEDVYVHTNHYIHGEYKNDQRTDSGSNSIFRLNKATELMENCERTVEAVKNVLRYRSKEDSFDNSIFQNEKDPYITMVNFTFDTEFKDKILLDVFVNEEALNLQYDIEDTDDKKYKDNKDNKD